MFLINRNIVSFCILLLPGFAVAQQDSTVQPHSEASQLHFNRYAKDPLLQPLLKLRNYGSVQLGFRAEDGEYRQAQAPQKQRDIFFYTEGSRQIKKFLVSGSFGWYNTQIDSQAYALRNDYKDPNPYYFYAAKPGNWQTIRYKLQGIVSVPVLDKITLGAGARYNSANHWRSNDPRPEEFAYDLQAHALAHYKLFPNHVIGITGSHIRKNSDISWEYRNDANAIKPETKVYIGNGYGNVEPRTGISKGSLSSATTGYTAEGMYEGKFHFGILTFKGKYENSSTEIFDKPSQQDQIRLNYGKYNQDSYSASLNWNKTTGTDQFNIMLSYMDELGKDHNETLAGTNYIHALELVQLNTLWSKLNDNRKMKYELGLSLQLQDQVKMDGAVGQKAEYQTGEAAVTGAYYFYFTENNSMLKTLLRAAYNHPFYAGAKAVTQLFSFTEAVVYRDYYYFNASTASIGAQLTYQFPVMKKNAFVQLSGNYTNAKIPGPKDGLIPYTYPGNNRMQWQCSIGVNL
jgi:hypothetical protein